MRLKRSLSRRPRYISLRDTWSSDSRDGESRVTRSSKRHCDHDIRIKYDTKRYSIFWSFVMHINTSKSLQISMINSAMEHNVMVIIEAVEENGRVTWNEIFKSLREVRPYFHLSLCDRVGSFQICVWERIPYRHGTDLQSRESVASTRERHDSEENSRSLSVRVATSGMTSSIFSWCPCRG